MASPVPGGPFVLRGVLGGGRHLPPVGVAGPHPGLRQPEGERGRGELML